MKNRILSPWFACKLLSALLLAPLVMPLAAHAQAYKCKQANGTVSFQDSPCPAGASGAPLALKAPAPSGTVEPTPAAPTKNSANRRNPSSDYLTRRNEEEVQAYNENVKARNRQIECNSARQQLGVVKAQRPIYRTDNAGERQYVSDDNRQSEPAAAERRVAQACQ